MTTIKLKIREKTLNKTNIEISFRKWYLKNILLLLADKNSRYKFQKKTFLVVLVREMSRNCD